MGLSSTAGSERQTMGPTGAWVSVTWQVLGPLATLWGRQPKGETQSGLLLDSGGTVTLPSGQVAQYHPPVKPHEHREMGCPSWGGKQKPPLLRIMSFGWARWRVRR